MKIVLNFPEKATTIRDAREEFERKFLEKALEENGGNVSETARVIEMERSALHRKLKALFGPKDKPIWTWGDCTAPEV